MADLAALRAIFARTFPAEQNARGELVFRATGDAALALAHDLPRTPGNFAIPGLTRTRAEAHWSEVYETAEGLRVFHCGRTPYAYTARVRVVLDALAPQRRPHVAGTLTYAPRSIAVLTLIAERVLAHDRPRAFDYHGEALETRHYIRTLLPYAGPLLTVYEGLGVATDGEVFADVARAHGWVAP